MCLVQHVKVHFHCISAKSTLITKQTGNTNSAQKNTKYCLIFTLEIHKCKKTKTKVKKKKKKQGAKYVIMYFNFDISSHRLQFTRRAFPDTASLNLRHETQHSHARFKSAQPAKDRTQLLFKQTHLFVSIKK